MQQFHCLGTTALLSYFTNLHTLIKILCIHLPSAYSFQFHPLGISESKVDIKSCSTQNYCDLLYLTNNRYKAHDASLSAFTATVKTKN